jgi:hypothetical protein
LWKDWHVLQFRTGGHLAGYRSLVQVHQRYWPADVSGIETIKKGQFKIGKLGGTTATMPEIWRAALAA